MYMKAETMWWLPLEPVNQRSRFQFSDTGDKWCFMLIPDKMKLVFEGLLDSAKSKNVLLKVLCFEIWSGFERILSLWY